MISYTEICHCSRSKPLLPQTLALKKKTGPCCLISRPWLLASRCCRICLGADVWRGGRWVLQVSPSVHWGLDLCSQHLCWLLKKKKKIPIVLAEAGTECACVRLQGCLFSELWMAECTGRACILETGVVRAGISSTSRLNNNCRVWCFLPRGGLMN